MKLHITREQSIKKTPLGGPKMCFYLKWRVELAPEEKELLTTYRSALEMCSSAMVEFEGVPPLKYTFGDCLTGASKTYESFGIVSIAKAESSIKQACRGLLQSLVLMRAYSGADEIEYALPATPAPDLPEDVTNDDKKRI